MIEQPGVGDPGIETRAAVLGVVAGMRSQLPLALLAGAGAGAQSDADGEAVGPLLRSPAVRVALGLLAAGELIGDKLPVTPSRLSPAPFLGRIAFGALAGGVFAARAGHSGMAGAAAGGTGAVVGTFAFGEARVALTRMTGLPDPVWAVAEDVLAFVLGLAALRR